MKTNSRVILICLLLSLPFTWYAYEQQQSEKTAVAESDASDSGSSQQGSVYERPYSPSFGPVDAKVTIVEFFDPACGACRAFYPIVKEIQSRHTNDVRVVLRYATFHEGSDMVVRMLEAARLQGNFEEVLEALLIAQSEWTLNHKVVTDKAWQVAETAGLDKEKAKQSMMSDDINKLLVQEKEDIRALKVSKTPTFYVNERALQKFGAQELYNLVIDELNNP